ncbi:MAG: MurR/RpiR family transcriptional regulator [Acetivibrionales bacterium]|jgi:DNA-binding MurR/RpiR family transcriptional regulator
MSDFLNKVSEKFDMLTHSQKTVAAYVLDNLDTIAFNTLEDIAYKIGVSTTTIIRFARILGFNGYSDMQKEIQTVIRNKVTLPERLSVATTHTTKDKLLTDCFKNDIMNINRTLKMLSEDNLSVVVDSIANAGNIYIVGMRSSFALAHYTASRLGQIKENVRLIQSVGMIYPEEIVGAKAGDICIAFLFPRYSKTTANIVSWFKKKGIKVILITSQSHVAVDSYADIILPCDVSGISYKNSFVAPMCLINYIAAAVALNNYDESIKTLKQTEDILSQGYYLGL